jgi:hypothetical protein
MEIAHDQLTYLIEQGQRTKEEHNARGERERFFHFEYEHSENSRGAQDILAYDAESAFKWFAYVVIEIFKLHPRNISYKEQGERDANIETKTSSKESRRVAYGGADSNARARDAHGSPSADNDRGSVCADGANGSQ